MIDQLIVVFCPVTAKLQKRSLLTRKRRSQAPIPVMLTARSSEFDFDGHAVLTHNP